MSPDPAGSLSTTSVPEGDGAASGPRHRSDQPWGLWIGGFVVACCALATFLPSLNHDFVYDDFSFVVSNPAVNVHQPGIDFVPWYRIWMEPYWPRSVSSDTLYRPLTTLSFRVNAALSGGSLRPRDFRTVNFALHMLTSVGVMVLAWRLTSSVTAGWLAGMLFAAHPVHVEAVVPIYGRSELLAACFGVWLLVSHVERKVEQKGSGTFSRNGPQGAAQKRFLTPLAPRSAAHVVLGSFMFLAAIMSKESAIVLWPALMLIHLWQRRRTPTESATPLRKWFNQTFAPPHIGFALATATFLTLRCLVFGWRTHLDPSRTRIYEVPMAHVGLIEHLLTPFRLLWLALVNLVWPDSLCPIWSYPSLMPANTLAPDVLAGMVLAGGLLTLLIILYRRGSMAGAILVGVLLTLAIPIQAIPVACWFYAERWLYLPSALIFVLLSWGLRRWGRAATIAGLAGTLVLMPQTWPYSAAFSDNIRMAHEIIIRQPDNFQGRRFYAGALCKLGRHDEAIQAANQMIERFGDVRDAYGVLIESYLAKQDGRRALAAIVKYENLRQYAYEPMLTAERNQAMQFIARQQTTVPAAPPTTGPPP